MHYVSHIALSLIAVIPVSGVINGILVGKKKAQWCLHSGGGISLFYVLIYKCVVDKTYLSLAEFERKEPLYWKKTMIPFSVAYTMV